MLEAPAILHSILEAAAWRFADVLRRFKGSPKAEGITERNLSFQAAAAFQTLLPGAAVFLEVPFSGANANRVDRHLDAYLFSPRISFLVECKQLYSSEKLASLSDDARRLTPALYTDILALHTTPPSARAHPAILADTWHPHIARWWVTGGDSACRWSHDVLPAHWHYGSLQVAPSRDSARQALHWLYAVGPDLSDPPGPA